MSRAAGLLLGFAADRAFGDPQRWHPVAGFGQLAAELERRTYADSRLRGVAYTAILVGSVTAAGLVVERSTRRRPVVHTAATALATWVVLGGRSLGRESAAIGDHLQTDDLDAARQRLTHLVARETSDLSADEIARAVVESVAENASDAVVAPLFWGAVAGVPGLVGYRAANTLDAMVGYKNPRHLNFGRASARFDDVVNLPAARAGGVLVAIAAPTRAREAIRIWRRDAAAHPSPNAGVVESAFAGALGVRLGGSNTYHGVVEDRVVMGDGPAPAVADIARANRLADRVGFAAVLVAAAGATALGRTR
ncbi:cobalamin biosynthesis protein CobD [Nocardioides baekrokdamisoli]|uniref:Cobalamin biosynthesis protein CobD n=1 Tax=Nocardioides baekrokdamisoli TaxID=1804624 RepID=A0A3G9ICX1_9ACTN|nr:cobalamin biosynthesis protein [Nocardioides baekrokdamisoli]BBH16206.1 cobalamin biosynthesis protein CobD [Nocardioides baekrokdamisoli]